jgi:hypothetical protein
MVSEPTPDHAEEICSLITSISASRERRRVAVGTATLAADRRSVERGRSSGLPFRSPRSLVGAYLPRKGRVPVRGVRVGFAR